MHRELEWPVSKATCLYKKLYMVYSFLYTIIEGTRERRRGRGAQVGLRQHGDAHQAGGRCSVISCPPINPACDP